MNISVVIPSAGAVEMLMRTLPSLVRAADHAGIVPSSIVIVDDRPGRPGLSALAADLGIRVVETGGIGLAGARNAGAQATDTEWLSFSDDDVLFDLTAFEVATAAADDDRTVVIGGLRPPAGAPRWLRWTYEDATLTPASGLAPRGVLPPVAFGGGLSLLPRRAFDAVGGFPPFDVWGAEDAIFGLRIGRAVPDIRLVREPGFGGVHLYEPTWPEWLDRRAAAGRRLAELERELPAEEAAALAEAQGLGHGLRPSLKRAAGRVPVVVWRIAVGRLPRRIAAAAAEARAYDRAHRAGEV